MKTDSGATIGSYVVRTGLNLHISAWTCFSSKGNFFWGGQLIFSRGRGYFMVFQLEQLVSRVVTKLVGG